MEKNYKLSIAWYVNSCVPLNKAIEATKAPLIMLSNPECFHVGDVVAAAIENTNDKNYIVFACYALSEQQTRQFFDSGEVSYMDPYSSSVGGNKGWYNHSVINPRPYHFASCITRKNMDKVGGFDEDYAYGISWDDDDFLQSTIEVVGEEGVTIIDEPFVFHQWHYKPGSFNHQNMANPSLEKRNKKIYHEKHPKQNI